MPLLAAAWLADEVLPLATLAALGLLEPSSSSSSIALALLDDASFEGEPAEPLAEAPLAALALWALGTYLLLGYWMRRVCLRVGLAGLAIHFLVRRVKLLPAWMVEWPQAGGALRLTDAEAQYLSFFSLSVMAFGFVVLGSMMLAARPATASGPVVLMPPPVPSLPGPTPPAPVRTVAQPASAMLPTHPDGRVMRRFDV